MKAAFKADTNYVNTAWEEYLFEGFEEHDVRLGAKCKMHDDFEAKGLTAIMGCGMTSGYASNVIARHYVDKLDSVESIKFRLAKKDTTIPTRKKSSMLGTPVGTPNKPYLILSFPHTNLLRQIHKNGKFLLNRRFGVPEPIGKEMVSHHAHEEPFSIPHSFAEKGLKYCDFKYYVNKQIAPIIALGLGREEEIDVKGTKVSPLDVVLSFVPAPGDAFLNEDPAQFDYLDKTKIVSIMQEIKGKKDGKDITYLIHIRT